MQLSDVTGVFSRYFVVGFFLPAYIALIALWLSASSSFIPDSLQQHSQATQLLVVGAAGLIGGLVLSGLSYPLLRLLEGYPLLALLDIQLLGTIPRAAIGLQHWHFRRLSRVAGDASESDERRENAAWRVDQYFPETPALLLPTSLGNAIRAFERHSNIRWGLDGITIWPRIDALLGPDERQLHVDATIDLYVFVNAAVGSFVLGVCLLLDNAINHSNTGLYWALYVIPFALAYLLYRASIGPAVRWGDVVRSSVDLHRLEIYEKLGVRAPTSFSGEREIARTVSQVLLYGRSHLSDDLWRKAEEEK